MVCLVSLVQFPVKIGHSSQPPTLDYISPWSPAPQSLNYITAKMNCTICLLVPATFNVDTCHFNYLDSSLYNTLHTHIALLFDITVLYFLYFIFYIVYTIYNNVKCLLFLYIYYYTADERETQSLYVLYMWQNLQITLTWLKLDLNLPNCNFFLDILTHSHWKTIQLHWKISHPFGIWPTTSMPYLVLKSNAYETPHAITVCKRNDTNHYMTAQNISYFISGLQTVRSFLEVTRMLAFKCSRLSHESG